MRHHLASALSATLLVSGERAVAQDTTTKLPPMVTVTRQPARSPFDLPFGISTMSPDSVRPGQAHIAADQTLMMVPGLTIANRSNPSQDVRVSVRGFGARSAFGVRSIRVIRDGMPLTLPDGQTPIDYLDLESVGRIEVIRGAASALYGNASGGVIDIHSVDPGTIIMPEVRLWVGSNSTIRTAAVVSGTTSGYSYQGNIGQTSSDNYRAFSHQRLTNMFGRLSKTIAGTDWALVGLGLHMPVAENPGALNQAQLDTAPRMADSQSVAKKARKEVEQLQIGLSAHRAFGPGSVTAAVYGGTRSLYNPLTFAVVDVGRSIAGASVHADFDITAVGGLRLTLGGDFQRQDDARKNFANCNGLKATTASCPSITVEKGVLQLDQRELVTGGGPYGRLGLDRGRLHLDAGVRADEVRFEVDDHFLSDGRDDSGVRTLRAVSPMGGIAWRATRLSSVYANYATAFETPTTTELGNQVDGSAGLNSNLLPQSSRTLETGVKGIVSSVSYEISLFHTKVRDELIQFQVPGGNGRMYFANAGRTRRDGVEFAGTWSGATPLPIPGQLDINWAYAYSRFRFEDFVSGTSQLAGKTISGMPVHQLQMSAMVHQGTAFLVLEGVAKSSVWANDLNTASAKSFHVFNYRVGRTYGVGGVLIAPTVAVNNLTDARYAGSVVINATAAAPATPKFFEPSPGRTWLVGARVLRGR